MENENEADLDSQAKLVGQYKNEEKIEMENKNGRTLNANEILTAFGKFQIFF